MKNSRSTQPYRKGQARQSGLAMKAMQKGATAGGFNPMDVQRKIAKGGNAPRKMLQPVARALTPPPSKGVARTPKAKGPGPFSKFQLHKNTTGNERDGQTFRTVAGTSKSGQKGVYHEYAGGKRVFVAKGPKPKSLANRARRPKNSSRMSG